MQKIESGISDAYKQIAACRGQLSRTKKCKSGDNRIQTQADRKATLDKLNLLEADIKRMQVSYARFTFGRSEKVNCKQIESNY